MYAQFASSTQALRANPYSYVRNKLLYTQSVLICISCLRTKPYSYVRKIRFTRKSVLVRISRFERTCRIRTQKLIYAQKTYSVRTSRLERTSRIRTQKSVQTMQSRLQEGNPYNLCTQTATAVSNKSTIKVEKYFKRHGMQRAGQVHTMQSWLDQGKKGNCTHNSRRLN